VCWPNPGPPAQPGLVARGRHVLDVVEDGGKVAVAFRMGGRRGGTLRTSAGPGPPTGQVVELRVIDVLTITDGRISDIWMVADELGALVAVGAVQPWSERGPDEGH
jgi:ketosteroid isomerase-like protein